MIRKIFDTKNKFISLFNTETGAYMRTGIINEKGEDTGVDPFMATMPQLLDIGVMGHCIHGKSGLCAKSGVQCYQNGLNQTEPNMTVEDFENIIKQVAGTTFQVALGGRGDVNKHEHFEELLKICRKYNVVPNYTTSGLGLTQQEVEITKKYCGAVACSEYRGDYTRKAIKMFIDAGVKTNIHYVLGNNSIDEAIDKLENNSFDKGINAVVFLLHKPVGQGQLSNVLRFEDPKVKKFYETVDNCMNKVDFKIGFDSCNVPSILNFNKNISEESIDTCEAARYSAYIDSNLKMIPCSFDNQELKWAVDLRKYSVEEAWNSKEFDDFRSHFDKSCSGCRSKASCLGGCPIRREIVICGKKTKDLQ